MSVEEVDIEQDEQAAEFVRPVKLDGRTFHCSPYNSAKLERELNLGHAPPEALDGSSRHTESEGLRR